MTRSTHHYTAYSHNHKPNPVPNDSMFKCSTRELLGIGRRIFSFSDNCASIRVSQSPEVNRTKMYFRKVLFSTLRTTRESTRIDYHFSNYICFIISDNVCSRYQAIYLVRNLVFKLIKRIIYAVIWETRFRNSLF